MANLSFVIYTNLCLEFILLLSQIYFVADKNFTVEKAWIYAALGDTVILFGLSVCWLLIYRRERSSGTKVVLRIIRAIEAIFSFLIAVLLVLLVQKSDLSKACVGYDHNQTPGPCNRFAFILFAAILAVINGMTYFFSPTIRDPQKKPKMGKPVYRGAYGYPAEGLRIRVGPPTYSQPDFHHQPQPQFGHPVPVTQAYNPTFANGTPQMAPPPATAVVLESDSTSSASSQS